MIVKKTILNHNLETGEVSVFVSYSAKNEENEDIFISNQFAGRFNYNPKTYLEDGGKVVSDYLKNLRN